MAFGSFNNGSGSTQVNSEINMVPLIDVMLVLLVIFIITAPMLTHSIKIDVPQVSSSPAETEPKVIDLAIDAQGGVFWDEQPILMEELVGRFEVSALEEPQPEIQLRADKETRYEVLAQIMGDASRSGMKRIGFVSTPSDTPAAQTP
ncbi:MAG: biopolymer transporter ExbD [Pigmentiphaga sp.]